MAIEKMMLVNIHGPMVSLDEVMVRCLDLNCFHPQSVSELIKNDKSFLPFQQVNPYSDLLQKTIETATKAGITLRYQDCKENALDRAYDDSFLKDFLKKFDDLSEKKQKLSANTENHRHVLLHLNHLEGMDVSLDDVFSCEYVKVRFGRLPADSYAKLQYYNNEMFFFSAFDRDDDYYWGVYFTNAEHEAVVDNIFLSLYFERIRIPEYVHGTPKNAIENITAEYEKEKKELAETTSAIKALVESSTEEFLKFYSKVKFLAESFDLRKYIAVSTEGNGNIFYMVGFIPKKDVKRFEERFAPLTDVVINILPGNADSRFTPPTKLVNSYFARPFEMFVTMYGTPSPKDVDPTPFVAITYTLLFGIMFGDLGQGLLIALIGSIVWRKMGQPLGRIMERIGISSALFGCLYGSVFGYEHLLDPFYINVLGLPHKPVEVMDGEAINVILLLAVATGAMIILISILINIVQGIRQKNIERALLDANGIAGLMMYGSVLFGVVLKMFLGIDVFTPIYIVLLIVIPALLIFFKEPIAHRLHKSKKHAPEGEEGGNMAENIFELFEIFLSFATNTMSFLRVGGFVLSHAGMMMVVSTLSEMVGSGASPAIVIFGNLFVICLEGMIVGIQVLRLEFYEMFSRFFSGDGVPFEPVQIHSTL